MGEKLSARAYAKTAGLSHTAVNKAIKLGRLRESLSKGRRGKVLIDRELADREWMANTDQAQRRETKAGGRPMRSEAGLFGEVETPARTRADGVPTFADSRARREFFLANLARLEYQEKTGHLVEADDMRVQAYKSGRELRDAILAVPSRIADTLAAIARSNPDNRQLRERLFVELVTTLDGMSKTGLDGGTPDAGERS